MQRCHVPPDRWQEAGIHPTAEQAHHLINVLRLKPGDRVVLFDGLGREVLAELVHAEPAGSEVSGRQGLSIRFKPIEALPERHEPALELMLLQAIPKGSRMDWIVEKAVELGARVIRPIICARGIVRPTDAAAKRERWQRVASAAVRQCGSAWETDVRPLVPFRAALEDVRSIDLFLVASLEPDARTVRDAVAACAGRPGRVALLVGPEGDLTPEEYAGARQAGGQPVTFGSRVLRVETAALYGLAVLQHELGHGLNR
ncbi:MAG: hypothetical protein A2498_00200 [Lentisphaerae bacterium RIFOXYC12_FULL_60_16]|nr:MAG: hypothetical protein A2498_00200 [Lentisphaerae bacterium RIFOXYC12_FULL_60_16]OGV74506.1 MAG: hypothetical protein A2269_07540 [Lentisphaerae bacterium RIFOXYA12_FULL_60_10]